MTIYWAPLFHFYQPPTQTYPVLRKIYEECYQPLLQVWLSHPKVRATVNINGILTELFHRSGFADIIEDFKTLAQREQVEFTGSGMYHPILPLIPTKEVERQIELNRATNRHYLGMAYDPEGFFPPEMAYGRSIVEPIISSGHHWVILSGVACPVCWPMDTVSYITENNRRLAVFFRDDILSNKISFGNIDAPGFMQHLRQLQSNNGDIYVITAMDAETFGHHIPGWEKKFLARLYQALEAPPNSAPQGKKETTVQKSGVNPAPAVPEKPIEMVTISQLLDIFPRSAETDPRPSSWSTSPEEIQAGNYYPLWRNKSNPLHQILWNHLEITMDLVDKAERYADDSASHRFATIARETLDRALHSDQFWWAIPGSKWDINLVFWGFQLQRQVALNASKAIVVSGCPEQDKKMAHYMWLAILELTARIYDHLISD